MSFLISWMWVLERGLNNIRPKTNRILKILEPKTLATAKSDRPFIEERVDTAHSGAEVPIPRKITPTKKGLMWNREANKAAFFTNNSAPTVKVHRPKTRISV